MRLPWQNHQEELCDRIARERQLLVVSDFDGTLSCLTAHPSEATLVHGAAAVLTRLLAAKPRVRLGILSGRALSDLASRLPAELQGISLGGNHGLEMRDAGIDWIHPEASAARPDLEALLHYLEPRLARYPGVIIEDKGHTLTLHYRLINPTHLPALMTWVDDYVLPNNLQRHEAKMAIEFRPRLLWHKGLALRRMMASYNVPPTAVIFLGDDTTDETAIEELGPAGITVHVGSATETSSALWQASEPGDVVAFLEQVLQCL